MDKSQYRLVKLIESSCQAPIDKTGVIIADIKNKEVEIQLNYSDN